MKLLKIIISVLFITLFNLNSFSFAETLKFDACSYEGDVKKGKAWGSGVCIFSDGSKYEGQFKKNKIHGEGKFTDSDNNVYEGKFRYGKLRNNIDKMTREILILKLNKPIIINYEIRGTGPASSKWFEALKNSSGLIELTPKGKRDLENASKSGGDGGGGGGGGCG